MRGLRTAMKSGPHLPQLEKALAQKQRPNTAKNKEIKTELLKKKKKNLGENVIPSNVIFKKKIHTTSYPL